MKKSIRNTAAAAAAPTSTLSARSQNMNNKIIRLVLCGTLFVAIAFLFPVEAQNSDEKGYLDRFTYREATVDRGDGFFDYRPEDWNQIKCDEGSKLDECEGYNYKWHEGINCA
jgi:hypothetical protein